MKLFMRSLQLDFAFLRIYDISLFHKLFFIMIKYLLLVKNSILGFTIGKSYITVFGKKYFYQDKFGTAFLQSVYIDNAFLSHFISPGSVIIDVGANIGQFNFFCKNFLSASKVYSFEPIKSTFNILMRNSLEHNYQCAVSTNTSVTMHIPKATSLMASGVQASSDDTRETVDGKKLDDIEAVKNEWVIDLLKIDTEGTELDVLKASIQTAKKSRYILVEASMARKSLGDVTELIVFLENHIPNIKLIWVGRPYMSQGNSMDACDMLFYNDKATGLTV